MTSTPTIEEFEAAMHPNVSVNHQPGLGMGLRVGHGGVKKGELIGIQLGRSVNRHSSQPRLIEEDIRMEDTRSPALEHYELRNELRYEKDIRNALRAS